MKFKDAMQRFFKNLHPKELPSATIRAVTNYRLKYITSRNAGIRPLFHIIAVVMLANYAMEFSHLRKHDALRKYH